MVALRRTLGPLATSSNARLYSPYWNAIQPLVGDQLGRATRSGGVGVKIVRGARNVSAALEFFQAIPKIDHLFSRGSFMLKL